MWAPDMTCQGVGRDPYPQSPDFVVELCSRQAGAAFGAKQPKIRSCFDLGCCRSLVVKQVVAAAMTCPRW
jgi:hypothetical protein